MRGKEAELSMLVENHQEEEESDAVSGSHVWTEAGDDTWGKTTLGGSLQLKYEGFKRVQNAQLMP